MRRWVSSLTLNNADCGFKSGIVLFVDRSVVYATLHTVNSYWALVHEKTDLKEHRMTTSLRKLKRHLEERLILLHIDMKSNSESVVQHVNRQWAGR